MTTPLTPFPTQGEVLDAARKLRDCSPNFIAAEAAHILERLAPLLDASARGVSDAVVERACRTYMYEGSITGVEQRRMRAAIAAILPLLRAAESTSVSAAPYPTEHWRQFLQGERSDPPPVNREHYQLVVDKYSALMSEVAVLRADAERARGEAPVSCEWYGKSQGAHSWVEMAGGGKRCIKCKAEIAPTPTASPARQDGDAGDAARITFLEAIAICTEGDAMNPAAVRLEFSQYWPGNFAPRRTLREAIDRAIAKGDDRG